MLVSATLVAPLPPGGTWTGVGVSVISKASRSCTVNGVALAAVPSELVIAIGPVVAASGTMTFSVVALPPTITAGVPLNRIRLLASTGLKPTPFSVTEAKLGLLEVSTPAVDRFKQLIPVFASIAAATPIALSSKPNS